MNLLSVVNVQAAMTPSKNYLDNTLTPRFCCHCLEFGDEHHENVNDVAAVAAVVDDDEDVYVVVDDHDDV